MRGREVRAATAVGVLEAKSASQIAAMLGCPGASRSCRCTARGLSKTVAWRGLEAGRASLVEADFGFSISFRWGFEHLGYRRGAQPGGTLRRRRGLRRLKRVPGFMGRKTPRDCPRAVCQGTLTKALALSELRVANAAYLVWPATPRCFFQLPQETEAGACGLEDNFVEILHPGVLGLSSQRDAAV
jgi:hypothetical protein